MYQSSTKSRDFKGKIKNKKQKIQALSNKTDVFENGQEISEPSNYQNNKISKYGSNFNRNRKKNYFQILPDEILLKIFSRLPQRMLKTCYAMVCRRWNKLSDDFSLWKKIDYGRRIIRATDIRKFVTLPVEQLDLSKAILKYYVPLFPVPFKKTYVIKGFSRLQYLDLNQPYRYDNMKTSKFAADILSVCTSLKILKLHGIYLNFTICHRISKNKDLKELYCISCTQKGSLNKNVFKIIRQCEKLETVDFTCNYFIPEGNLITNTFQSCLRSLILYFCWIKLENDIKPIIDCCPNITYLKMVCWNYPPLNILKLIANSLHMLKTFDMSYFGDNSYPIEDLFLFKEASNLTELILSDKYTQSDITSLQKTLKNVTISRATKR